MAREFGSIVSRAVGTKCVRGARVGEPGGRNLRCISKFINGKIFSFKLCLSPQIFRISDGPGEL